MSVSDYLTALFNTASAARKCDVDIGHAVSVIAHEAGSLKDARQLILDHPECPVSRAQLSRCERIATLYVSLPAEWQTAMLRLTNEEAYQCGRLMEKGYVQPEQAVAYFVTAEGHHHDPPMAVRDFRAEFEDGFVPQSEKQQCECPTCGNVHVAKEET